VAGAPTEDDQRKARQGRARGMRAEASDPCWTRHHDENNSNNVRYLIAAFRTARKTPLMELKQLWLMSR